MEGGGGRWREVEGGGGRWNASENLSLSKVMLIEALHAEWCRDGTVV